MNPSHVAVRSSPVRVKFDRFLVEVGSLSIGFFRPADPDVASAQTVVVSIQVSRRFAHDTLTFRRVDIKRQGGDDRLNDFILDVEIFSFP